MLSAVKEIKMRPILKSLTGMAFGKSKYLSEFESQCWAVAGHLAKILLIDDLNNELHWVEEIDTILDNLALNSCVSKVTTDEIKKRFIHYSPVEGKDWRLIKPYFINRNNPRGYAYIYNGGLKACKYIPTIMGDFVDNMDDFISVKKIDSFKDAIAARGEDTHRVTLEQLIKLKNKALK